MSLSFERKLEREMCNVTCANLTKFDKFSYPYSYPTYQNLASTYQSLKSNKNVVFKFLTSPCKCLQAEASLIVPGIH